MRSVIFNTGQQRSPLKPHQKSAGQTSLIFFLATWQLQGEGQYRTRVSEISISPGSLELCNDSWHSENAKHLVMSEEISLNVDCVRQIGMLPRCEGTTGA